MRKVITITIAIIAIVIAICAPFNATCALADTDQEILFRGLSWDLPADEYELALYDTWFGRDFHISFLKEQDMADMPFFDGYVNTKNYVDVKNYNYILDMSGEMYVAGYNVSRITGSALPLVKNGVVGKQLSDYRFASWEYRFRYEDADVIYDDLSAKLSFLYGTQESLDNKSEEIETASIWSGSNNTCAVLIKTATEYNGETVKTVRLVYTFSNLADWVAAIDDPSSTVDKSSIDGL